MIVSEQKWNIPNIRIFGSALFKQTIAQVRALGKIAKNVPPYIIGVGIVRIEGGDDIQRVIDPFIFF